MKDRLDDGLPTQTILRATFKMHYNPAGRISKLRISILDLYPLQKIWLVADAQ